MRWDINERKRKRRKEKLRVSRVPLQSTFTACVLLLAKFNFSELWPAHAPDSCMCDCSPTRSWSKCIWTSSDCKIYQKQRFSEQTLERREGVGFQSWNLEMIHQERSLIAESSGSYSTYGDLRDDKWAWILGVKCSSVVKCYYELMTQQWDHTHCSKHLLVSSSLWLSWGSDGVERGPLNKRASEAMWIFSTALCVVVGITVIVGVVYQSHLDRKSKRKKKKVYRQLQLGRGRYHLLGTYGDMRGLYWVR